MGWSSSRPDSCALDQRRQAVPALATCVSGLDRWRSQPLSAARAQGTGMASGSQGGTCANCVMAAMVLRLEASPSRMRGPPVHQLAVVLAHRCHVTPSCSHSPSVPRLRPPASCSWSGSALVPIRPQLLPFPLPSSSATLLLSTTALPPSDVTLLEGVTLMTHPPQETLWTCDWEPGALMLWGCMEAGPGTSCLGFFSSWMPSPSAGTSNWMP